MAPGQSVWLRHPKNWKFGRRWIEPYQIISRQGVNYKLRSKTGTYLVVHHNQVKASMIPFNRGEPYCPVREVKEMEMVCMPREERPEVKNTPLNRPPRLRQNVQPTLWFGDFVTHSNLWGDGVVIDVATLLWHIGQHIVAKFIMT